MQPTHLLEWHEIRTYNLWTYPNIELGGYVSLSQTQDITIQYPVSFDEQTWYFL